MVLFRHTAAARAAEAASASALAEETPAAAWSQTARPQTFASTVQGPPRRGQLRARWTSSISVVLGQAVSARRKMDLALRSRGLIVRRYSDEQVTRDAGAVVVELRAAQAPAENL